MKKFMNIIFFLCVCATYVSSQADQIINERLDKFVFLSCNNHKKKPNTNLIKSIEKKKPQLMLWIGDYFYSECRELKCLKEAYEYIKKDKYYINIKKKFTIDGIYDDHDYNCNNGDRLYKYKKESKTMYLDYLGVDKNDIRYKRNGAYFSKLYIDPNDENNQVKIIILDTRYNKDPYPYYSIESHNDHFISLALSLLSRVHASLFGFYCNSNNDILGNEQWKWLEKEFTNSKARAHIVISSIQVFANFIINENWGLMPAALKRLKALIKKTKPKGLVFLSGDVHYGSIIGNEEDIIEVTSSNVNQENIFSPIINYFAYYISYLLNKKTPFIFDKIYGFSNYGEINITYPDKNKINLKISINSSNGEEVISANQSFNNQKDIYVKTKDIHLINDDFACLSCKSKSKVFMIFIAYILYILWCLQIFFIILKIIIHKKGAKEIHNSNKEDAVQKKNK
ncbi:alkaline phosphatase, putative [Plasmodium berghei]|uniref:Alkaline phosphatase, putative n=3 Tax=Plasmodium berghei TaxID=5821 RepID=A0A509AKG6_PLABA|nr:alkaline phosphatase, putative [Plasmodium berghei ANKA]CXI31682.1 alkaline phosphatase, putative [Plasmodium berghei]SCO59612.1 alkaline phosphatase, putative [Plasmodium berghei]VUC55292.1 alkaline phosphatase, putative [Plasmodium berghei ANKA]|eukprot:XP_034421105.1 alkaline phosphatase, putative [Plasmodium berghei ANKA]